jgi:WD40 repeat protein/serine/threonine protein kinase
MGDLDLCGRTLGDFVLRTKIDEGGFGLVYRAEQQSLKRTVVVKVLHPERIGRGASVERFLREARLAAQLDHPYAAHVYASGVEEDVELWWIAMELVKGVTLAAWLKKHGAMPLERFVPFFDCVAEVLHEAHVLGIVHRDLKPDNMMVIERGGRLFPKLLDFGIAKADHEFFDGETILDRIATPLDLPTPRENLIRTKTGEHERLTPSGIPMGSVPYTAPEQWCNAAEVGPAADIYSLGVVIYEALSGRRPFTAKTASEYAELHRYGEIPRVDYMTLGYDLAKNVDRVLGRALGKYPLHRQDNVLKLAEELQAVLRASDRQQLRASAQQWQDQACPPGMLWGGDVLAKLDFVTEQAAEGNLGPLECSFVAASQRRARRRLWLRRALVALAPVVVIGVLLYRGVLQKRMADRIAIESEIEQGRQSLLNGKSSEAVHHLGQAYERGERGDGVMFMFARALQPRMSEIARFTDHSGRVWSAVFAPDDKRVLTTDDKSAQMWDAASGQRLFAMSHGDTVYAAAFSSDGSKIITAGGDGTVRIWNAATGAPIRELRYQGSGAKQWRYAAVATSSSFVAATDTMGRIAHVWDAETGTQVAELANDGPGIYLVAFSGNGHWLATSGRDEVRVFDTLSWRQVAAIPGPRVRSLAFDPASARLAIGTNDGVAAIWDVPSGARLGNLRDAGASVDAVAFSRDGALVAAASRDGMVHVWSVPSGSLRTEFHSHRDKIYTVEFSASGDLLLTAGADGAAVLSNVATGLAVARLEGPKSLVIAAHFDSTSRRVVGASWDGTARVWNAASPYRRWASAPIGPDCNNEESLVPDQRYIALACPNHGTRVWDTSRGEQIAELPEVTSVEGDYSSAFPALTAAGDLAAIARGKTVEVYAIPSGQLIRTIVHPAAVNAVAFASSGHDLVSGAVDGSLLITRGERDSVTLAAASAGIDAAAILADGRVVVAAGGRLRVIDPDRNALLMDLAAPRIRLLRTSPDGRRLVGISTTREQSPPTLWDLEKYSLVGQLEGHIGRVFTARFVGDGGHQILTAGADGTARLWSAATGRPGQTFQGDSHFLVDAALAPDGSVIVAGGSDGFLRFWDAHGRLLWTMQAHRSYVVGLHYEGDDLVTRGFAGDVAGWSLPPSGKAIDACRASACASVNAGK